MKNITSLLFSSTQSITKNAYAVFIISLILIVFTSCEKLLKEEPKSLAVENFYNTKAEVEAATNAIYSPLIPDGAMPTYVASLEVTVDYSYGRGSWAPPNEFKGLDGTNIGRITTVWNAFYLSIRNANLVIKNAPNGSSISNEDIAKYVAEAKFMRAFDYFQLVRSWDGVPIRTEADMTSINAKRNSVDEVYNLIIADLKEAETNLPDIPGLVGRPSKWAAKTLLADVYLQRGEYAQARDKAKEVIESKKYSLVGVTSVDDWQKIFGPDVVTTPEEIFYIKFSGQPGYGNWWVLFPNHPGTKLEAGGGYYGVYSDVNNLVQKNWDPNDLRKGLWYIWDIGLGPTTILSKKLISPSNATAGNDITCYRYADVLLIYAEAACRADNAPTASAIEAVNQVHRRAYGKDPNVPSTVDFNLADYNETTFLDLILRERGYEFQYEGKRWLTLKRTGKADDVIMAVYGKTIDKKAFLWPIPTTELNFNKALDPAKDQNVGY